MPPLSFVLQRLVQTALTLVVVTSAVFLFLRLAPGDPAAQMLGLYASDEAIADLNRQLGLDQPLWRQYLNFWGDAARADLGTSFRTGSPVAVEIATAFVQTLQLAVAALLLAIAVGVPLGIWASVTRYEFIDRALTGLSSLALAAPVFWIGLLMMLLFSLNLGWLPASGTGTWQHLVMPAVVLSTGTMAQVMRLVRSQMLEVLEQPYIAVARSKGISSSRVLVRHALRNALLPVVTQVGIQFGNLLGGAVLTEIVFAWPGLGRLVVNAVYARDYPLIQAAVITLALVYMLINLLVDITYSVLDPRIKHA